MHHMHHITRTSYPGRIRYAVIAQDTIDIVGEVRKMESWLDKRLWARHEEVREQLNRKLWNILR